MRVKVVAIDVDEPVAMLIQHWVIERYNEDWQDCVRKSDLTDWNIAQFMKPECGNKIYDYLKFPSLYDGVRPTPLALAGVNRLREMGKRIIYVTHTPIEQSGRKYQWLKDYGFIDTQDDYFEAKDKSMIRADVLFDDGFHNVSKFNGVGFLLNSPWNRKFPWDIRVNHWYDFIRIIEGLE